MQTAFFFRQLVLHIIKFLRDTLYISLVERFPNTLFGVSGMVVPLP